MGIISNSFFHLLLGLYHAMTRTSHGMIQDLEIFVRVTVDKILEILPFALDFKKLQKKKRHRQFTIHYCSTRLIATVHWQ